MNEFMSNRVILNIMEQNLDRLGFVNIKINQIRLTNTIK